MPLPRPRTVSLLRHGFALAALAAGLAAPSAHAEEPSLARIYMQREVLGRVSLECGTRHPVLKAELESKLAAWTQANASRLAEGDRAVQAVSEPQRNALAASINSVNSIVLASIDAESRDLGGEPACRKVFAKLSSTSEQFDADDIDEAFGMYLVELIKDERIGAICLVAAGEGRAELEAAQALWQRQDADIIRLVRERVALDIQRDPAAMASLRRSTIEAIDASFSALTARGPQAVAAYCRKEYAERTDGTRRRQKPNMYRLLEQALDAAPAANQAH